tara:strand:- start:163 stop:621 length:459 start_codon:yes stop_codon:yes gene_type:complete
MYTKPKITVEILQGNIEDITPEMLLEKQPVVIFDKIVDIEDIIRVTFKYLYSFSKTNEILPNNVYQSNSRYTLLHNTTSDALEININKSRRKMNHLNAFYTCLGKDTIHDDKQIKIILQPHNVLVVPYLYTFQSNKQIAVTFLNDFTHIISP